MNLRTIKSSTAGRTGAAIIERGLLGAVTLLASLLLGRWGGPEELGLFAIFFPLVFVAIALQESLVIVPYMVYSGNQRDSDQRRRYFGSVLVHAAVLGGLVAVAFGLAGAWFGAAGQSGYSVLSWALAIVAPCVLLREFARRMVYAERRVDAAIAISGGVGAMQLLLMAMFYAADNLNAATAFAAMGASSAVGGLIWLWLNRAKFGLRGARIQESFRQNLRLGGWNVATQVSEIVRTQMFPWLLVLISDARTVGVYAACAVVAALLTPLQVAISNVLLPEFVHVQKQGGYAASHRLMWQATATLTAVMAAFCLVVAALNSRLVPWLYGEKFSGFPGAGHALIILSIAQLFTAASLPAARALLVFDRPREVFASHFLGILVNVVFGAPMAARWGIVGAAYAALFGSILKAALGGWWYAKAIRPIARDASPFVPAAGPARMFEPTTDERTTSAFMPEAAREAS